MLQLILSQFLHLVEHGVFRIGGKVFHGLEADDERLDAVCILAQVERFRIQPSVGQRRRHAVKGSHAFQHSQGQLVLFGGCEGLQKAVRQGNGPVREREHLAAVLILPHGLLHQEDIVGGIDRTFPETL